MTEGMTSLEVKYEKSMWIAYAYELLYGTVKGWSIGGVIQPDIVNVIVMCGEKV